MKFNSSLLKHLKGITLNKELKKELPSKNELKEWEMVWEKSKLYNYSSQKDNDQAWNSFIQENDIKPELTITRNPFRIFKYVASISLLICAAAYLLYNSPKVKYTVFSTDNSKQSNYNIGENIIVKLNYNSQINHKLNFNMFNKDTLRFNGEGFFKVKPKKNTDFYILSNNGLLHITGTVFNLKTSNLGDKISVTRGKVSITANGQTIEIPAEKTCIINKSSISLRDINSDKDAGWVQGILVFENQTFKQVIIRLEKKFNQQIQYPAHLNNVKYTGVFKQNDIDEICKILSLTYGETIVSKAK